jgi:hypothetical protein
MTDIQLVVVVAIALAAAGYVGGIIVLFLVAL